MTDMFISIDGEATLGTKCPTHKLEIKKMTEIEEVKAQLKVLQSKLSFLEELSKTKSPVEKAFYRVYGCYPPTTPSVSNSEDERWSNFQKGYNASKEEYKVEEEPEEFKTLYQMMYDEKWCKSGCDEFCDVVKRWMSQYTCETNKWDEDYKCGFLDCLDVLRKNLKQSRINYDDFD